MRLLLLGTMALWPWLSGCGDDPAEPPALSTLEVTTVTLPNGAPTVAYDQRLTATGGDGSYTWDVTGGTLPEGLHLNASTGQITGTPTGGTETFTVEATSGDDQAATQQFTLTLNMAFNLDFGGFFTGLPDTFGAAAGLTGTWVDVPYGTSSALVNTLGTATSVSIELNGMGDAFHPHSSTESILLRDAVVNPATHSNPPVGFSAALSSLQDGEYEVHYYFYHTASGMTMNEIAMNDLAGGSADGLTAQGTNWDVVTGVTVTGGTLTIMDDGAGFEGLSGIQVVHLP